MALYQSKFLQLDDWWISACLNHASSEYWIWDHSVAILIFVSTFVTFFAINTFSCKHNCSISFDRCSFFRLLISLILQCEYDPSLLVCSCIWNSFFSCCCTLYFIPFWQSYGKFQFFNIEFLRIVSLLAPVTLWSRIACSSACSWASTRLPSALNVSFGNREICQISKFRIILIIIVL